MTIKPNVTYRLADTLTIESNVVLAGILSGMRQYQRNKHKIKDITDLEQLVSSNVATVLQSVQGEHQNKEQILASFKLYLLTQIVN